MNESREKGCGEWQWTSEGRRERTEGREVKRERGIEQQRKRRTPVLAENECHL